MTMFDRLEPRIPELRDELAPAKAPAYFDDMLRQTARTRQRPAWSSFERWLPMGVIARTAPIRQVPWRPILLVALVGLLAAAALVVLSGAGKPRLPAPFGPARNGVIATSINGDIVTVDPVTGSKTVIIGGPEADTDPVFSSLGNQLLFIRNKQLLPETTGPAPELFMADADGSNVRQLDSQKTPIWLGGWDWAADGRRLIYTPDPGEDSIGKIWILDTATGMTTEGASGIVRWSVKWRPGHDQYVFGSDDSGRPGFYVASTDGSAARAIAFPDGGGGGLQLSPDGSQLVYVQGEGVSGPLRTLDIETGQDRPLTQPGDGYLWSNPQFSPDGTKILAERRPAQATATTNGALGTYDLMLLPVAGAGPVVELGRPVKDLGAEFLDAQMEFSPDGTSVLASFQGDGTSWMFDVAGGAGRQLDWPYQGGSAWQRLAP
jgi:Tol biopolymer transport system component